jgi:hypothetical protein
LAHAGRALRLLSIASKLVLQDAAGNRAVVRVDEKGRKTARLLGCLRHVAALGGRDFETVILTRSSGRGHAAIRSISAGERYPIAECNRWELWKPSMYPNRSRLVAVA